MRYGSVCSGIEAASCAWHPLGMTQRFPGAADGPRYRALGNSMAVPVMRWIGQRLLAVDSMPNGAA